MDPVDMIDLGRKYDSLGSPDVPKSSETSYPSLYLTTDGSHPPLPDGQFYAVVVLEKRGSESYNKDETGRKTYCCTLNVHAIQPLGDVEDDEDETPKTAAQSILAGMQQIRSGG